MLRIGAPIGILLIGLLIVVAFLLAIQSQLGAIADRVVQFDRSTGQFIPCASSSGGGALPPERQYECVRGGVH